MINPSLIIKKHSKEDLIDTSTGFNVGVYELVIIFGVILLVLPILLYNGKPSSILIALITWILLLVFLFWKLFKNKTKIL